MRSPSRSGFWTPRTCSRGIPCSSSPPARRTPACWPRSSSRPAGRRSSPTTPRRCSRRRRRARRRSERRTSKSVPWRPSGSTCRPRASTRCCAAGATCCSPIRRPALRETRRVLRPGGRVALAAWAGPDANPWFAAIGRVMVERGLIEQPPADAPGPLAFGRPGRIEELLDAAGIRRHRDRSRSTSPSTRPTSTSGGSTRSRCRGRSRASWAASPPAEHYALRDAVDAAYAPYVRDDGSLEIPARALVAAASA